MIDTPLTRASTQASMEIVPVLRDTLVGRRFASINPYFKGDGKTAFEMTKISDLSDGFVQWSLPTGNEFADSITSTLDIVKVPVLYKKFEVRKEDILAWDNRQVAPGEQNSLNLISATTASRKVAEQEEEMIFNGWKPDGTNYAVKGFTEVADNVVTGGSIATVGTMYGYVCSAISALEEDSIFGENGSYNLAITPAVKASLMPKRYDNGDSEWKVIKDILGNGNIYVTSHLPAGTAVVTPVDNARTYFEFLNPVDYRIEFAEPKFAGLSPVEAMAYELFAPNYNYLKANGKTDAVAKITNLA